MRLDRIPGFAICARCGSKRRLQPCERCGLIVCDECRGAAQCAVCFMERKRAAERILRRMRVRSALRMAGVVTCLAASGMAAVGAALLPEPPRPLEGDAHLTLVARGELRFVGDAVERWAGAHGDTCPPSLASLRRDGYLLAAPIDPWGEPLLFGCVEGPRAFVVLSKGADREAGTDDDLMFAAP